MQLYIDVNILRQDVKSFRTEIISVMMPLSDVVFLSLTAVWGIIFIAYVLRAYVKTRSIQLILWAAAAAALLAVGSTLLLYGFEGLALPYTSIVGMFTPGLLAAGLISALIKKNFGVYYAVYTIMIAGIYAATRAVGWGFAIALLLAIHVPSGLLLIFLPAIAAFRGIKPLALTSIGGLLISVAGVALATMAVGRPLLPVELVLQIATPIIFLSTLLITLGLIMGKTWIREVKLWASSR
ncbi:MAG: hypothetical protein QXV97_05700 [Candidatus Caldarchaeum sp.]